MPGQNPQIRVRPKAAPPATCYLLVTASRHTVLLTPPPSHLPLPPFLSPGCCSLGQPKKVWKSSLVGKLVQPRWAGGYCCSPPAQTTWGAAAQLKVPST